MVGQANADFGSIRFTPHTPPPRPNRLRLLIAKCAGKYYAESCSYPGSAGNETQSRESNLDSDHVDSGCATVAGVVDSVAADGE
jgi:hypothetical protein